MLIIENFLLLITVLLLVPTVVLFIECSAAFIAAKSETLALSTIKGLKQTRPKTAVLVPAHNEELEISSTIRTLLPQLKEQDRLVVIADNCSDRTAIKSRELGATVIERENTELRGKGYALEYGMRFIETDPPDVVIIIDADCIVHPGTIERLAYQADALARPIQSTNLLKTPDNPSTNNFVSALAFMVKNLVRPRGLALLGMPCLLMGTGMAFPWHLIKNVSLATSNSVEDIQLGVDLAIAGSPAALSTGALVTGSLPAKEETAFSQRKRWEHGHLRTLFSQCPILLKESIKQRRFDLFMLALDLSIPPLSLLVMMLTFAIITSLLLTLSLGISWIFSLLLGIEGLLIFMAILLAWTKFKQVIHLPLKTLVFIPSYIASKLKIYFLFLKKSQKEWYS
ncbi:MAG: glycosyltransferase family 2 protein [Xenococcus sp. MO_188.B8]|nr:glycosyltransferase family 2 protein [Xenococcus sp. MO_188.B8]